MGWLLSVSPNLMVYRFIFIYFPLCILLLSIYGGYAEYSDKKINDSETILFFDPSYLFIFPNYSLFNRIPRYRLNFLFSIKLSFEMIVIVKTVFTIFIEASNLLATKICILNRKNKLVRLDKNYSEAGMWRRIRKR